MFDERKIIARILAGDRSAFTWIVRQYERLVWRVVSRLVASPHDCADVCQEVFLKVHQHLHQFKHESKLSTWVARIAFHQAINFCKARKISVAFDSPEILENTTFVDRETPLSLLEKQDAGDLLRQLVAKLPKAYQLVVALYHWEEMSYQEIAEVTGMPEGTVKSYLFRARNLLKTALEKLTVGTYNGS